MNSVDQLIAHTLRIDEGRITDDLEYQSVREWDSLGHVTLMMALENAYGTPVDDELTLELRTVAAIRAFAADHAGPAPAASAAPAAGAADDEKPAAPSVTAAQAEKAVHRGLEGVSFDHSAITRIDGAEGVLEYRGYSIHDLAEHASYTEVAHLLVHGELPDAHTREAFEKELCARRALPPEVLALVRSLAHAHPMDALLACLPALAAYGPRRDAAADETYEEALDAGITLLARVPMLVAAHHAVREGREPVVPAGDVPAVEAFLTLLLGTAPTPAAVRFMNKGLIVHADHSSNASAFAARVATGARAGMNAALTAAVATFGGSVHGGAAERVVRLIDDVGDPAHAAAYVAELHGRGEPVMGFGHRVYRTEDPRVRHLRATVAELSAERGDTRGLDVLDAVAAAMGPYARRGVAPNVDLYAGLAYRLLGLPDDLAVPLFVVGRTAGWVAQVLEQHANNVLIRPLLSYDGPRSRRYEGGAA
ncbi:citrate/2-methylcitrate synthase [Streptomyces sp. URMC 124]|uniref:citrate/2-methylcitrate synthase n=1 Tax=Streptomyces sp. URMC 124 TaxID=3423405 RepID=UPI003F1D4B77